MAMSELAGVGDASLGEWFEWTGKAFHLRRRLSEAEAQTVGPVKDIRNDRAEVARRLAKLRHRLPPKWSE